MNEDYRYLIKSIFKLEKLSDPSFIQGSKKYNHTKTPVLPTSYKKRPYVIYKAIKSGKPVVVKILLRKNYKLFFARELFVIQNLGKLIPQSDKYLPELISFGLHPAPYFIIRFYSASEPMGNYNLLIADLPAGTLTELVGAIETLHLNRLEFEQKIAGLKLRSPFVNTEPYNFYISRFFQETKKYLVKMFGLAKTTRLQELFKQSKKAFTNSPEYFCWGDANPANVLYNKNTGKFIFIDFEKAGYSYPARDFTTLYYSIYLKDPKFAEHYVALLKQKFTDTDFWQIFYFKLLIYSFPRQFRYFKEQNEYLKQKKIVSCAKLTEKEYINYF